MQKAFRFGERREFPAIGTYELPVSLSDHRFHPVEAVDFDAGGSTERSPLLPIDWQDTYGIPLPLNQLQIDRNNWENLKKFNRLNRSRPSFRFLELEKQLLGENHPDVEKTLDKLIENCEQIGCYTQAELLRIQKQEIQNSRQRMLTGNDPN